MHGLAAFIACAAILAGAIGPMFGQVVRWALGIATNTTWPIWQGPAHTIMPLGKLALPCRGAMPIHMQLEADPFGVHCHHSATPQLALPWHLQQVARPRLLQSPLPASNVAPEHTASAAVWPTLAMLAPRHHARWAIHWASLKQLQVRKAMAGLHFAMAAAWHGGSLAGVQCGTT